MNTYEITIVLEQRGDYIEWVEEAIQSGLRDGEQIHFLDVYQIPEHELTEH